MPPVTVNTDDLQNVIAFCVPDITPYELEAACQVALRWSARRAREQRPELVAELSDAVPATPHRATELADAVAVAVALRVCAFSFAKQLTGRRK